MAERLNSHFEADSLLRKNEARGLETDFSVSGLLKGAYRFISSRREELEAEKHELELSALESRERFMEDQFPGQVQAYRAYIGRENVNERSA